MGVALKLRFLRSCFNSASFFTYRYHKENQNVINHGYRSTKNFIKLIVANDIYYKSKQMEANKRKYNRIYPNDILELASTESRLMIL